jgi:hypothetical protein
MKFFLKQRIDSFTVYFELRTETVASEASRVD